MNNLKVGDIVTMAVNGTKIVDRVGSLDAIPNFQGMVWCESSHYVSLDDLKMATPEEESEFFARENIFVEGTAALLSLEEPEYI